MGTPVIGITASTLVLAGMRGVSRFALSNYYVRCVTEAGGLPIILPNVTPDTGVSYLSRLDGLVMSGGLDVDPIFYDQEPMPDLGQVDQVRDAFELELVKGAKEQGIPLLTICRGTQVMNVAFGGTLLQHIPGQVEGALKHEQDAIRRDALAHTVDIVPGTKLHELAGTDKMRVNTFHHQACEEVADGFIVSARAMDGVIEAIEDPDHPFCVGVQWHPERRPMDELTRSLFSGLVVASRAVAQAGA